MAAVGIRRAEVSSMEENKETDFENEAEGSEGGELFRPEERKQDGTRLIAKSKYGAIVRLLGIALLLLAVLQAIALFYAGADFMKILEGAAFFLIFAFVALVLREEKEIRIDQGGKKIILRTSRLFFGKPEKIYLYSQVVSVFYQGSRREGKRIAPPWMRFEFRDGTKFDCEVYGDYVPGKGEFGVAKVEYKY